MLRTLTLKSQLKFGKFANYSVDQMFQIEKQQYLCWVYYNSSNISFIPEILERLGITYLIAKPGTDKLFWDANKQQFDKPIQKKEITLQQAAMYKKQGKHTKKRKIIQSNFVNHESQADLMYHNRTKK